MPQSSSEILLQMTRIGNSLRVTAVHAATGIEAVFQAPANASPLEIKRLAANKLRYVMTKKETR